MSNNSRNERLAAVAERCPSGKEGHVNMIECHVCGFLDWHSTEPTRPVGFSVSPMHPDHQCQRCNTVAARAPEVFRWVLGVLQHHTEGSEQDGANSGSGTK